MNEFTRMNLLVAGFFADCDMLVASLKEDKEEEKETSNQPSTPEKE